MRVKKKTKNPLKRYIDKLKNNSLMMKIISVIAVVIIGALAGMVIWYEVNIQPADSKNTKLSVIEVDSSDTASDIAMTLQQKQIIRNKQAFYIYSRLSGDAGKLQAGTYRLSPSMSVADIVSYLVGGKVDKFEITLYPGATLTDNTKNSAHKYAVTTVLEDAGYSASEIKTALADDYTNPSGLFAGKPADADLEGYIYGDTYSFNAGTSVKDIVQKSLSEFYDVVKTNDLTAKFAKHNLTLYQGITLASIIEKEANTSADRKQVAQVFYSRLDKGIALGSDVTYQYIADKLGVTRDPSLDSPYNTRLYKGLPPGPISVPSLSSLQAAADPADGNYLYFLSGDDGKMHYAYTDVEHEANISKYCKIQCASN